MVYPKALSEFYEGEKVLVTGGAGFIGSHLVEMLVQLGATVTVPVRKSTKTEFLKSVERDIDIVEADLSNRDSVDSVMRGQRVVMHLAAAKGGGIAHSMLHHGSLFRDNMLSFINVLDSARLESVGRFLVTSSACVYPRDSKSPTPEEEGFRDAPEPTNAGYGWSKRMKEFMALSYAEEYGMNIGVLRPFNAYGPRDDFFNKTSHVIPDLIKRVLGGESPLVVWGSGKQTRSFLHVRDFAYGLLMGCADNQVRGPLNIGSDEETSIGELASLIIELSGTETGISFDLSKPDGQPRRSCDTTRAKETLGFEAKVPLREGLKESIEWYRKEKQGRNGNS
jgi:GDP-L-fucose synthase